MEKTLYNCYSDNCCAYCQRHQCAMTVKQMKCKDCLNKQCKYLIKKEGHYYWRQREFMKQKRKERKARLNALLAF